MDNIFEEFGLQLSDDEKYKFSKYKELLLFYNNMFNITAITDEREIYIKHFIDSVIKLDKIPCGKLIDIGSGGGFPALPIKIMRENQEITMMEATNKKCEFLKTVIKELDLKNVFVINGRAEELSRREEYRELYDICTARAVAKMNTLAEYALPFVKVGGQFIAYKTYSEEEIETAKYAIKTLGGNIKDIEQYTLDGADRSLIIIDKNTKTSEKYPRGKGKERKSPL